MSVLHAKLARQLFGKIAKRMQNFKVEELQPKDLAKWLEVSVRIERISRGAEAMHRVAVSPTPRLPAA